MNFQENTRVKRKSGSSCLGTIIAIREEIDTSNQKNMNLPVMLKIKWDNGKVSYFDPESVAIV